MTKKSCGQQTEVYSRIVGYYRPINNWNNGKKEEFHARKTFKIERESCDSSEAKKVINACEMKTAASS